MIVRPKAEDRLIFHTVWPDTRIGRQSSRLRQRTARPGRRENRWSSTTLAIARRKTSGRRRAGSKNIVLNDRISEGAAQAERALQNLLGPRPRRGGSLDVQSGELLALVSLADDKPERPRCRVSLRANRAGPTSHSALKSIELPRKLSTW